MEKYKQINQFKKQKKHTVIKELIKDDGSIKSDHVEISNNLNDSFIETGLLISSRIAEPDQETKTRMQKLISPQKNSVYLYEITPEELQNSINKLDGNKSTPSNCGPIWILKKATPLFIEIVATIFNMCMSEGIFPDVFKTAEIIPVYKAGSRSNVNNYRPIALLNPFSKLFEKCIYDRLINFFNKNNIIHENQFGFRQHCSTENAILKTVNEIVKNIENNNTTISLFLDLRKAFETVNHEILLQKLYKYGIRGAAYNLMSSFLTKRSQYVRANNVKSSTKEVTCGIPQGSTLGPLTFSVFINDFIDCSKFNVNLFADDAYLSFTGKQRN